jgi:S-adenosylmethionine decarboxylase
MANSDFAGTHLLIDLWGARHLDEIQGIEQALVLAANAWGATVLGVNLHSFGENSGVTGVALLAESHISIHTWAETGYAALDVFMCGACDPRSALPVLQAFFAPQKINVTEVRRGEGGSGAQQ